MQTKLYGCSEDLEKTALADRTDGVNCEREKKINAQQVLPIIRVKARLEAVDTGCCYGCPVETISVNNDSLR